MRDESLFRPSELLQLCQADARALLTILARHRASLTPLERATLDTISEIHSQPVRRTLRLRGEAA